MADYYKILGLSPEADNREIRAAYRRLAKKSHPDAGEGSSAERFRAIQDAYELLTDPERRKEYDRSREKRFQPSTAPVPHYSAPSVHTDLRDILRSPSRNYAEPIEFKSAGRSVRNIDDDWEDLLRFLFREF